MSLYIYIFSFLFIYLFSFYSDEIPASHQSDCKLHSPPTSEADAACSVVTTSLSPATSDQSKNLENDKLSKNSISEKQKNSAMATENIAISHHGNELSQNVVDLSSGVNSGSLMEKRDTDDGNHQGIDLNKTPQQKPPKRRKHRPKVVVEGKPKRTPKTVTPKTGEPTAKRKYVRKKQSKDSQTGQAPNMGGTVDSSNVTAARSCKKSLNFEMEGIAAGGHVENVGQQETQQHSNKRTFNLNLDSQAAEKDGQIVGSDGQIVGSNETETAILTGQPNGSVTDQQQLGKVNNLVGSINQFSGDSISRAGKQVRLASTPSEGTHLNTVETRIDNPSRNNITQGYIPIQQHMNAKGVAPTMIQANIGVEKLEITRKLLAHSTPQSPQTILSVLNEARGPKRGCGHVSNLPSAENQMSSFLCQNMYQKGENQTNSIYPQDGGSEMQKRRKTGNVMDSVKKGRLLDVMSAQQDSRLNGNRSGVPLPANYPILNSQYHNNNTAARENYGLNNSAALGEHCSFVQNSTAGKMGGTSRITSAHGIPVIASEKYNLVPPTPPNKVTARGGTQTSKVPSKRSIKPTPAKSKSDKMSKHSIVLQDHQHHFATTRGIFMNYNS